MLNSTALLGGGNIDLAVWDISAAGANALFPGLRLFGVFDAATSSLVWLFSTSFRDRRTPRRTPRLGRLAPPVSPTFSPSSLEEKGGGGGG
jgi:hypothetical protein